MQKKKKKVDIIYTINMQALVWKSQILSQLNKIHSVTEKKVL